MLSYLRWTPSVWIQECLRQHVVVYWSVYHDPFGTHITVPLLSLMRQ